MSTNQVPSVLPPCRDLIDAVDRLRNIEEESPGSSFEDIIRRFEELRQISACQPPPDPVPQVSQKRREFLNYGPGDFLRGDVNGVTQAVGEERAPAQSPPSATSDRPGNDRPTRRGKRSPNEAFRPHSAGYFLPVPPPHFEDKTIEIIYQSAITHFRRYGRKTYADCPEGCCRLNSPRHLDLLENMINNTPYGSHFRHFVAYCTLGHDIHRHIPQMLDDLPGIRRNPIEIPFERALRGKDPKGAPGIPFLEVLYKWDNLVNHTDSVSNVLSENLKSPMPDYFHLHVPVHSNEPPKHYRMIKLQCQTQGHSIKWFELAIYIVKVFMENKERGTETIVFGSDKMVYPIRSILHARLVSLLTLDKKIWWPRFSTATIEPENGKPTPSLLNSSTRD
ncbi:hypothetical protein M378DRAFT_169894, partial [Amanita muscaria Koide BX008]